MKLFGILTEKERNLVNQAITQEREKIIKLLEKLGSDCECSYCWRSGKTIGQHYWYEIELIKGETNG